MPHDLNGEEIKIGDRILIPCIVKSIQAAVDFCNLTVETEHKMPGNDSISTYTLNTKMVVKEFGKLRD